MYDVISTDRELRFMEPIERRNFHGEETQKSRQEDGEEGQEEDGQESEEGQEGPSQ